MEEIIRRYIQAYNEFDIGAMLTVLHPEIRFQNVSNGVVNTHTAGRADFEALARQSASLFSTRHQSVRSLRRAGDAVIAEIDFVAVPAVDTPFGLKAGEKIELQGSTEFLFQDGLILSIVDRS